MSLPSSLLDVLQKRVSLRRYDPKPLRQADVDVILEAAMRAPTAGNMMMYSILIISDNELKQRLSETCDHQPFIAKAPFVLVFLADMQRWFDYYHYANVAEYCIAEGKEFCGPDEADLLLAGCDALIAAQNSVIAAETLGIGSCYIGDIMENYETHRDLLKLPPWVFPVTMLCFGYYPQGERPEQRPRFERQYIVSENGYKRLDDAELASMFAKRSADKFDPKNAFNAQNYGQFLYARKTGADYAAEMARSVQAALKNWRGDVIVADKSEKLK
ncbi:MAG: nitroreductase family protein [Peptococcaceae bacterium]|nr:nitroreductase family protein [Peptococcaceae bacterium]